PWVRPWRSALPEAAPLEWRGPTCDTPMTASKQLRLGGFFSVPGNHLAGWRHPDAVPSYDMDFQGYAHITQVAEAAKFDTIFFQDTVGVAGSRALARGERTRAKLSRTVKLEPTATLAALAMV